MATAKALPAPWRDELLEHINKMDSPELVFSTLHKESSGEISPRARYCIFRGFWTELPENKHNDAPKNKRVYSTDMPTITTDARMHKIDELGVESDSMSGGGGRCEAVWWAVPTKTQWRVRGRAYVLGPDIDDDGRDTKTGSDAVRRALLPRMRVVSDGGQKDEDSWDWGVELTAHFGNMSPGMRGSFANPPPGQPVDKPLGTGGGGLQYVLPGDSIEELDHKHARRNFRVVVIAPDEVESIDLSDPKTARRQFYRYEQSDGSWSHVECWP